MRYLPIFSAAAFIGSLQAQTPVAKPATRLPDSHITAAKKTVEARRDEIIRSTAGGASVTDAEDFLRGRATTIKDALDFTPGVLAQSRFGAEESRVSIRGSGMHQRNFQSRGLWMMQDGIPLNLADGSFDVLSLEPLATGHVEVFRGANALQYGSTTLGGAINFISRTGRDAAPLQMRVEAGSFDTIRTQLSSGFVSGDVDGYLSLTSARTDGFRDRNQQENYRLLANIGLQISANLENRFYITYVDSRSQIPGTLTKAQMLANPQQANPTAFTLNTRRDLRLLRLADRLVYSDGDHSLALSTFWTWKDVELANQQINDQLSNDFGFDLRYDGRHSLFGMRHDLTIGTGLMYGRMEDNRFANVGGQRGALAAENLLQSINFNFYFQDQIHLNDTLSLLLGASTAYASRDLNEQRRFGGENSDRQEFWGFNPRIGLLWDITPAAQLYFNASRSFEPPTFGELVAITGASTGLVSLRPQTATTLEFGTRGHTRRLTWDLSYYYSWIDDELLTFGLGAIAPTLTTNAGRTTHQGVEFFLSADLWENLFTAGREGSAADRLVLRQNFLWNDFRFSKDARWGDRMLPGAPVYYYRAELLYEHPCGFYAGPNIEWSPRRFAVDLAHTTFSDPYELLGFKIGHRAAKGPSFYLEARNLADVTYSPTVGITPVATPATSAFQPGDGRSFFAGVEWRW